ncbi:hypothetical protein D3C83_91130 [compost metagenome]
MLARCDQLKRNVSLPTWLMYRLCEYPSPYPLESNSLYSMRISLPALSPARMPSSLSWKKQLRTVRFLPSCRMPAPF